MDLQNWFWRDKLIELEERVFCLAYIILIKVKVQFKNGSISNALTTINKNWCSYYSSFRGAT